MIKSEAVLIQVLSDVEEFLPQIVIVGGWVPFIFQNYVWKNIIARPNYTTDIDLGVSDAALSISNETLYNKFKSRNYSERHVELDKLFPIIPVAKLRKESAGIPIEFLCDKKADIKAVKKILGKEIYVNIVEHFNFLISETVPVEIRTKDKALRINIPPEERYIFHKLVTFAARIERAKMAKDLYYAYYMLRFSPNKSETLLKLKQFKILPEWRIAAAAIVKNFSAITSEGVVLVEKEFGQDSIIKNLRKHILETFSMLLKE